MISALLVSVGMTSFLGSVHCVGMCGGIALSVGKTPLAVLGYHLGRLLGYVGLGFLAGYLGSQVAHVPVSVQIWMTVIMGICVVLSGVFFLYPVSGFVRMKSFFTGLSMPLFRFATRQLPYFRGMLMGVGTAFLPCAWLYSFVLVAATSGSLWEGMVVMGAFWIGTVPLLLLGQWVFGKNALQVPSVFQGVLLILLGITTVLLRLGPLLWGHACH